MEDWCGEVEFFHLPFPYILECPDNGSKDHMKQHELLGLVIDCFSDVKALPSHLVTSTG
jgi:hypothetical protein